MPAELIRLVEEHDYQTLFLLHLRWSRPDMPPLRVEVDEGPITITNISSYKGLRVWACPALPNAVQQASIDRAVAQTSIDRLVIFYNDEKQIWRWPSRTAKAGAVTTRLTSHVHARGMENPKLLQRLELITLGAKEKLGATEVIERVKQAFDVETERETKRASKLMAAMFDALKQAGTSEHDISVTLARLLFLLFGDDTDMWKKDLFQDFILHRTRPDGTDLAERLNALFEYLDTKPENRTNNSDAVSGFKYVNGGLFAEKITLPTVGRALRETILEATKTDWSEISPAIFGSMFQSVRDSQTRREFGEHYTSEKDILRTLNPLFLDELRKEFTDALDHREEYSRLLRLRGRLGRTKFLDPACGCGNFIIIAFRELRMLEIAILERLRLKESARTSWIAPDQLEFGLAGELDAEGLSRTTLLDPVVRLDNFYGIEIDEWPAKIAETAMFLIDRQCDLQMLDRLGYAPERLPISRQATIVTATPEDPQRGNSLRTDWSSVLVPDGDTIVAGNPPYHGQKEVGQDPAKRYDMDLVWGTKRDGYLDYVTAWFAKAIRFFGDVNGRWAFVSTNSIAQGQPVASLFGPIFEAGWRIAFAYRTFPWKSEASGAAAVHCVIVGFNKEAGPVRLFTSPSLNAQPVELSVPSINAYLVDGPNVLVRKRMVPLSPGLPEISSGSTAFDWGYLTVEPEEYDEVASDPICKKYLRPYVGGDELINNEDRWCLWLVDATPEEIEASSELRRRVEMVREKRSAATRPGTLKASGTPHLFGENRQPQDHYLGIPQTFAEGRLFATAARLDRDVIANKKLFTAPDHDGYLFSVISSSMFITWQKTVGGRLKSDPSFSNTLVWNNLPLPETSGAVREAIISSGREILQARLNQAGRSLAEMYSPSTMATELLQAHLNLDALVDVAFGAEEPCSSFLERQEILFRQYASMIQC